MIEATIVDMNGISDTVLHHYVLRDIDLKTADPNKILTVIHKSIDKNWNWEDAPHVEYRPIPRFVAAGWEMREDWETNGGNNHRFYFIVQDRGMNFFLIISKIDPSREKEYTDKPITLIYNADINQK